MSKATRYSPELRERAIRLVFESRGEHESEWAAMRSIAEKVGCKADTLRVWVRQHQQDVGPREGAPTADTDRLKVLERENRELRKANEILKLASAFFASAELDRHIKR